MTDAIDLTAARIVNTPAADVASWPMTAAMTLVSFDGTKTRVNFTKKDGPDRWPDVTPVGWDGPVQYTIWLFLQIAGQWVGSGFIQMWNSRDGSGDANDPDVPSVFDKHWFYGTSWTPMDSHGPIAPGEQIGFMVTAGNARAGADGPSVRERSNVVVVSAMDHGMFTFDTPPVVVPVDPPVVVPPSEPPAPNPLEAILASLKRIEATLAAPVVVEFPNYEGISNSLPILGPVKITLTPVKK